MKQKEIILNNRASLASDCHNFIENYKGENFIKDVSIFLAENVGVPYVLIGYPTDSSYTYIKTAVLYASGTITENITYALHGTPCENVIGRNSCYFPTGIQKMFPTDKELQELNIESYIGYPLFSNDKKPIGLIVLMDSEMIALAGAVEDGLREVAGRTSQELMKFMENSSLNNQVEENAVA